eukprot:CAMPEP_0168402254 /NCGR_PEP_ID=MMETSP0228-20121227/23526_1 /TAXON_ID=133427 /ORGANISM="Protoceratium reticulatum, Strain CCCM 535 (=CCMP 1889)" /LENGTH=86 /DNA_ID=CAMNT_0008415835 /DNA_START=968 /DNA_END=1228 /DNA_ORIENTATION=-
MWTSPKLWSGSNLEIDSAVSLSLQRSRSKTGMMTSGAWCDAGLHTGHAGVINDAACVLLVTILAEHAPGGNNMDQQMQAAMRLGLQ